MKNSQIGFIDPNNNLYFMEYEEALDFCKKICESEINIASFLEFKKDYNYFNAYFDFIMFKLNYIMINGLYRNRCIIKYNNELYEIPDSEENIVYNYSELKSQLELSFSENSKNFIPVMTKCADNTLDIKPFEENMKSCVIDPKGFCMMSRSAADTGSGSHHLTCRTVLNQMLLNSKEIVMDYFNYGHSAISYLVETRGFIRVASKDEGGIIIGNSEVIPEDLYNAILTLPSYVFVDIALDEEYTFSSSSGRGR